MTQEMVGTIMMYWLNNINDIYGYQIKMKILQMFNFLTCVDHAGLYRQGRSSRSAVVKQYHDYDQNQDCCRCHNCKLLIHLLFDHELINKVLIAINIGLDNNDNSTAAMAFFAKASMFLDNLHLKWSKHYQYYKNHNCHKYNNNSTNNNNNDEYVNGYEIDKTMLRLLNTKNCSYQCGYYASATLMNSYYIISGSQTSKIKWLIKHRGIAILSNFGNILITAIDAIKDLGINNHNAYGNIHKVNKYHDTFGRNIERLRDIWQFFKFIVRKVINLSGTNTSTIVKNLIAKYFYLQIGDKVY